MRRRWNWIAVGSVLAGLCASAAGQEYRFAFFNLPDLGGGGSAGYGINELGHVVGGALLPVSGFHATLWIEGEAIDLGTLGGSDSQALDVNSGGAVVGWSVPLGGSGLNHRAFIWQNGEMADLGTVGGDRAEAMALTETDEVVGWSEEVPAQRIPQRAFLLSGEQLRPLYALDPGLSSQANGINDLGLVVGQSWSDTYGNWRAVLWDNDQIRDLGTARSDNQGTSLAYGVNDAGVVVGTTEVIFSSRKFPFRWENGRMFSIGVPQGASGGLAYAVNNNNQIVGRATIDTGPNVGFLWESGRMQSLDDLLPPFCIWRTDFAWDINDAGQISGTGYPQADPGVVTAFLMSPVQPSMNLHGPQPGTAGERNGLRLTGATPGARITFLYSRNGGGCRIPGCLIQTNALQLEAPTIIGTATANSNGVATITANVPRLARGQTFLLQAVVQGECAISQLVVHEFE